MMTFSVLWVVLAATVTVIAMMRRAPTSHQQAEVQVRQSGRALTVVAVIYSLVLLAGFIYVGWQHGLELMK
jgi:heme/copper-type cytochrome/quinol oxidase subunit 2